MLNNEEKIELVINKLNNVQAEIDSYIQNADLLKDKYSLEDVLPDCNFRKSALLLELESLEGTWSGNPLTN